MSKSRAPLGAQSRGGLAAALPAAPDGVQPLLQAAGTAAAIRTAAGCAAAVAICQHHA